MSPIEHAETCVFGTFSEASLFENNIPMVSQGAEKVFQECRGIKYTFRPGVTFFSSSNYVVVQVHSDESQIIRGIPAEEFGDWIERREASAMKIQAAWRRKKAGVPVTPGSERECRQPKELYEIDAQSPGNTEDEEPLIRLSDEEKKQYTDLVHNPILVSISQIVFFSPTWFLCFRQTVHH